MAVKAVTTYVRKGIGNKTEAIESAVSDAAAANPTYYVADVTVRTDSEGGFIVVTTLST